jgi:hypothetical protein
MPTYAQLEQESYWRAEVEAPAHAALNNRLRVHYGQTRVQAGSKGDNRHLQGRHRSRVWCLSSRYCTNRTYATIDARDRRGDGNWLRATDIGVQGAELRAVSARLDAAVLAGRLPCLAEWFGTIDGRNVTGWYQGRRSSSDTSHLYHAHVGIWTEFCDNAPQLQLLGDIITGTAGGHTPMLGLTKGDTGIEVEYLQLCLQQLGHLAGSTQDGVYGPATSAAVLKMRQAVGSSATNGDGISQHALYQLEESLAKLRAAKYAKSGPQGEPGERGPVGPAGPEGPAGKDGIGAGSTVTIVGTVTG